jgi:hypothetical protein
MLVMGAMLFSVPAYAADDPIPEAIPENLTVDAVWLTGDIINIEVTDKQTGINQTLRLPLEEYAAGSEYVSVQAIDRNGNLSNTIQFKNPLYTPPASPDAGGAEEPQQSESAVPDGNPFTPDGTGTVLDNATDGDGKEFFSIESADGNVFYLIVDRQRNADNVYFLNAVTEEDLMALAEKGDVTTQSAVPTPEPPSSSAPADPAETPQPEPPANNSDGMGSGSIIFIIIGAAAVGGAGYYFKIVKPKKQAAGYAEDDGAYDCEDEDADYEDGDPGEGGDRE